MSSHSRRLIALRYWLLGRGWHEVLEAMEFAAGYHTGTRKDGLTSEFAHQIAIASYLRTLERSLLFPSETLATAFLHDVREDYDVADSEIRSRFGPRVADAVDAMTKTFRGTDRDPDTVFAAIASDPVASIAKLADRIHNLGSLHGVFSSARASGYVAETRERFFPMLKAARRSFPAQEPAYENAKLVLENQCHLLAALHPAA